jgi:hypothetical protein
MSAQLYSRPDAVTETLEQEPQIGETQSQLPASTASFAESIAHLQKHQKTMHGSEMPERQAVK